MNLHVSIALERPISTPVVKGLINALGTRVFEEYIPGYPGAKQQLTQQFYTT